ncbi:MAG: hypothetical protein U0414_02950 [Polyangiaceae bacterium]
MSDATSELSAARLGEALAHLAFFQEEQTAVLAQLGYAPEEFWPAASRVRKELAAAVAGDRPDLVVGYAAAFEATMKALRVRRPRLSHAARDPNLEPRLSRRATIARPALVPLAAAAAPTGPDGAVEVPTFLRPPEPPLMRPLAKPEGGTPVMATPPAGIEETAMLDGAALFGGPDMPFLRAPGGGAVPRQSAAPAPDADTQSDSGTVVAPRPQGLETEPLPFRRG